MTGADLIKWIQDNNAEGKECIVQYRDSGGDYNGGEMLERPCLANFRTDDDGHPYDVQISYIDCLTHNCIVF